MGKKLYIGNVSFKATDDDIKGLLSTIGEVASIKMITDIHTGMRKGFGFVEMGSVEEAKKVIEDLNGTKFMERTIVISEARPQKQRDRNKFGGERGYRHRRGRI